MTLLYIKICLLILLCFNSIIIKLQVTYLYSFIKTYVILNTFMLDFHKLYYANSLSTQNRWHVGVVIVIVTLYLICLEFLAGRKLWGDKFKIIRDFGFSEFQSTASCCSSFIVLLLGLNDFWDFLCWWIRGELSNSNKLGLCKFCPNHYILHQSALGISPESVHMYASNKPGCLS